MPPSKKSGSHTAVGDNGVPALLLTQKAEVKEIHLPLQKGAPLTLTNIKTFLKKKTDPEFLGSYTTKGGAYFLFGYTSGKAGTENKHELPPPHDSILTFGDMIMTHSIDPEDWSNPVAIKSSDYETFYTKAFGGFEDLQEIDEEGEDAVPEQVEVVDDDFEEGGDGESDVVSEPDGEEDADLEEAIIEDGEEAEVPVPVKHPKQKAKKAKKPASQLATGSLAAASYTTYLHIDSDKELRTELDIAPYNCKSLSTPRKKIFKALLQLFKEKLSDIEIQSLERAIYNGAIRIAEQRHLGKSWDYEPFVEIYRMHAKHIAANFQPDSYVKNDELFGRYKAGIIPLTGLSYMDSYQLFESRWKDNFVQQQQREKRQLEGNKAMATDRFLCMRCHKRECTYYEMQTRSADEPMTIFITCLNCGKHWRQ